MKHNIILRAPEEGDIDTIFLWENERTLWESTPHCAPVSRMQVWQYVKEYDADPIRSGQLRLMAQDTESGAVVGHVDLFEIDVRNRRAGVAIFVSAKLRGQGYGADILEAIADMARLKLDLHQLWAHVAIDNVPSLALFKSAGYKSAGRLRSWLRRDGRWVDVVLLQRLFPQR